jgi:hypothetical protein
MLNGRMIKIINAGIKASRAFQTAKARRRKIADALADAVKKRILNGFAKSSSLNRRIPAGRVLVCSCMDSPQRRQS